MDAQFIKTTIGIVIAISLFGLIFKFIFYKLTSLKLKRQRSIISEQTIENLVEPKEIKNKMNTQDYESIFLVRKPSSNRNQCYISKYSYDKISQYLPVIGNDIPITTYLDNIIRHHLEEHKDEINVLYERNTHKPF